MPGIRRPRVDIEVERRNREQTARIGADIESMRERRGWTRIQLADRAGLGRMVKSRIERGVANPDLDALQRLAVALDRPLMVNFGGLAELEDLAVARSGAGATVGLSRVIRATARNRALVARYPEVFASRFPGSSRAWVKGAHDGLGTSR